MGTSVKQVYFRTSSTDYATLQDYADHFNTVTAAILESGMLQVSDVDYPGQAGTFVTTTPGAGETQITAVASVAGENLYGVNLFKHPVMSLYVLVRYCVHLSNSYAYRHGSCNFRVFRRLEDQAIFASVFPFDISSNYSPDAVAIPSGSRWLYASCENDHFWIYSGILANYTANSSAYAFNAAKVSNYTLAIFAAKENAEAVCIVSSDYAAPPTASSFTGPHYTSANALGVKVAVSAAAIYPFVQAQRGSICTLADPSEPAANSATRIARAEKIIDGQRYSFDFAWINAAVMNEFATAMLDIHGEGEKQYISLRGFGSGGTYRWNSTLSSVATPLMPWNP
ncbi:MAG: hypothetical protein ACRCTX_04875 [Afipia sp.]